MVSILKLNHVVDIRSSVDCEPIGQGDVELEWQKERLLSGADEHCETNNALRNALAQIGVYPI